MSMASDACPVCALILCADTPAIAALVASPAPKLWPEKPAGSIPTATTRSLMMIETASRDSRAVAMRQWRSTGRKIGLTAMRATASQSSRAAHGQAGDLPSGIPTVRPTPSWSVLERRNVMITPSRTPFSVLQLIAIVSNLQHQSRPRPARRRLRPGRRLPPYLPQELHRHAEADDQRRHEPPDVPVKPPRRRPGHLRAEQGAARLHGRRLAGRRRARCVLR